MSSCRNGITPHVSVVIPTLGERADYLRQTLNSILNGGVKACITIVDSSPGGLSIELDSRINVLRMKPAGLSAAINFGFENSNCNSDYLAWIGDDDFYLEGGLGCLFELLVNNPDRVLSIGACSYVDRFGTEFYRKIPRLGLKILTRYFNTQIAQPATMFRKSAWSKVGGLNTSLRYTMDLELWLGLWDVGRSIHSNQICAAYRWHADSLSSSASLQAASEALKVRVARFGVCRTLGARLLTWLFALRTRLSESRLDAGSKFLNNEREH